MRAGKVGRVEGGVGKGEGKEKEGEVRRAEGREGEGPAPAKYFGLEPPLCTTKN